MEKPVLGKLRDFRQDVHALCCHRADVLCDITDGALTAGLVPNFACLSSGERTNEDMQPLRGSGKRSVSFAQQVFQHLYDEQRHAAALRSMSC